MTGDQNVDLLFRLRDQVSQGLIRIKLRVPNPIVHPG